MRISNGFFKSFGSEFSLLFLDSVLMFSLLCLRVGIHFCCLRKSLCIRDTRTLETWFELFLGSLKRNVLDLE